MRYNEKKMNKKKNKQTWRIWTQKNMVFELSIGSKSTFFSPQNGAAFFLTLCLFSREKKQKEKEKEKEKKEKAPTLLNFNME